MSGHRNTPAQAAHIFSAYHARHLTTTSADDEDPNYVELRHQTLHLAELVACSAAATGQLGRDLDDELATLGNNGLPVATIVSSMIARSRHTEQQMASAAEMISKLREDVAAAKHDVQLDADGARQQTWRVWGTEAFKSGLDHRDLRHRSVQGD